jgi:hypothetical protein
MKLLPLIEQDEPTTPWGSTEEEIVTNIGNEVMSHINPIKEFLGPLEQAFREGDTEKAKEIVNLMQMQMNGVADLFQRMQDFLDNEGA